VIVVDTNIIAYLYIDGEHTQMAEQLLSFSSTWASPILWKSEFRNVLVHYMRRGILTLEESLMIIQEADLLLDGHEYEVSAMQVMQLANSSRCSAYDCEFVALAQDLSVPLITTDKRILTEFPMTAKSINSYLA